MTQLSPEGLCLEEQVLLHELDHRIVNEFASAIGAVSLAAARTNNDETKGALSAIAELLHHYADIHRALQMPVQDALIDVSAYLRELCLLISRSKLESRKIMLVLAAEPLQLDSDRCWRLGMITHELISNAADTRLLAGRAVFESSWHAQARLLSAGCWMMVRPQQMCS